MEDGPDLHFEQIICFQAMKYLVNQEIQAYAIQSRSFKTREHALKNPVLSRSFIWTLDFRKLVQNTLRHRFS